MYKNPYINRQIHKKIIRAQKKKKLLAIGATTLLCLAMMILSAVTLFVPRIGKVENFKATKIHAESIVLKWTGSVYADGYFVYKRVGDEENFSRIATLTGHDKTKFTVKNLEQKSKYDFYVTAFRGTQKTVESKDYDVLELCTRPKKITLTEVKSTVEGELRVRWKKSSDVLGYQMQYTADTDFRNALTVKVTAVEDSIEFQNLEPASVYKIRVRSYTRHNGKKLMGEWSDVSTVKIAERFSMPDYIDTDKPMVALTFDDGPGYNDASDRILDTLEKYGAKATFFMLGKNAVDHPDNVRRKCELKMELGNHTWDHTRYGKKVKKKDIRRTSEAIYDICGVYPTAYRSPGGMTTEKMLKECKAESMTAYYWSIDTEDWRTRNAKTTWKKVVNNAKDGDIILMHEIYDSTADAVEKIVPKLIKKGFQIVTCRDLISAKTGDYPEAGRQYYKAP
ncbi:MAG: polysaccharide deacetylase family protein [Ruminococcus sp.]|nr:polysaccharide deacetylase family protein [Ruminococcus sp.]